MGFPSVCYCVLLPGPLVVLLQILDQIRLLLAPVFHFLGLYAPPDFPVVPFDEDNFNRLDIPYLPVSPASIKRRLPVVQFSTFRRRLPAGKVEGEEEEAACAVCLCELEDRHQVRLLGNCRHSFHKGCIDRWVDLGQETCPLCRSPLLPRGCPVWCAPFLPSPSFM